MLETKANSVCFNQDVALGEKKYNFQKFFLNSWIQLQLICDNANGVSKFPVSLGQLMWSDTPWRQTATTYLDLWSFPKTVLVTNA